MTKEEFLKSLSGDMPYGHYDFETDEFSGRIGRYPGKTVIGIDSPESVNKEGFLAFGEYKTPEELLEKFKIGDQKFSETVLKDIQQLERELDA